MCDLTGKHFTLRKADTRGEKYVLNIVKGLIQILDTSTLHHHMTHFMKVRDQTSMKRGLRNLANRSESHIENNHLVLYLGELLFQ